MSKQTAVELYEKEINYLLEKYEAKLISKREFITMKHNVFYNAKEMEKEQIIEAHGEEQSNLQDDGSWKKTTAEDYYNETYKNETK